MAKPTARQPALTPDSRIVVFYGKEPFLIRERSGQFIAMLEESRGVVEIFTYDGMTASPADVLDELRTFGLLGQHKLVILDRAEYFITPSMRPGAKEEDDDSGKGIGTRYRRLMEQYAESPMPDATLLMRGGSWRKGKLDKLIAKAGGALIECDELKPADAERWCLRRCLDEYGAELERRAATILVERLGPDLARLDSEMAKLVLMTGNGAVTAKIVTEAVGLSREEKAWVIQEAIVSGDPGEALTKLHELLSISSTPKEIVSWAITDLLRKLHLASQMVRQGASTWDVVRRAQLYGAAKDDMLRLAKRTDPDVFAQLLRRALQSDARVKSGYGRGDRSLEALTVLVTDTIGCD